MHYTALAVLPPDTDITDEKALKAAVDAVMAPFDENLDVAPWKDYMTAEDVADMAEFNHIEPGDTAALEAQIQAHGWDADTGGRDERGFYNLRTSNPAGKWDWFEVGGRWDGGLKDWGIPTLLKGNAAYLRDIPPYTEYGDGDGPRTRAAVLAHPRPCWLEVRSYDRTAIEVDKYFPPNPRYREQVADICRRYPDHIGVLVDYHT